MKKLLVIIGFVLIVFIGLSQWGGIEVELRYGKTVRAFNEIRERLDQAGFTNVVVSLISLRAREVRLSGHFDRPEDIVRVGNLIDPLDGRLHIDRDLRLDAKGSNGPAPARTGQQ